MINLIRQHMILALGLPLMATFAGAVDAKEQPESKVVVTGSHIKRIDLEGAFPITVLDQDYIETTGASTTYELLQLVALNGGGTFNEQFTAGFTPGAAAFDLRGFGPDRTLVLLNGKRLPIHPFGSGGSTPFVDLNIIPVSIIQRIEILKDGASAIYGSDAIAGVVNIITEAPEAGIAAQVRTGKTTNGGGAENNFNITAGWSKDSIAVSGFFEWSKRDAILGKDRAYSNSFNGPHGDERSTFSNPGTIYYLDENDQLISQAVNGCRPDRIDTFDPAFGINGTFCAYDPADLAQISPKVQRTAMGFNLNHQANGLNTEVDYIYSQANTDANGFWFFAVPAATIIYGADHPYNPVGQDLVYERAFTELGAPTLETDSDAHLVKVSFDGMMGDFEWQFNNQYSRIDVDNHYASGWASTSGFNNLLTQIVNNSINPFQQLPSQQVAALSTSAKQTGKSTLTNHSFTLDGPIASLPHGELWLASGLELRNEDFYDKSDAALRSGSVFGVGNSGAAGKRDIWAGFFELVTPISPNLQLTLAGRYDHYDDFGSTFNPKVNMRWTPTANFLLRAAWGTGFRAPGLHQLHSENVLGSVGSIGFRAGGNPDLEAEESESLTLGGVWEIAETFTIALDAWDTEAENLITKLEVATILTATDSDGNLLYADLIDQDGIVNTPFLNVSGMKARGYDLSLEWQFKTQSAGALQWKTDIIHLASMQRELYPNAGYESQEGMLRNPKNRINSLLTWEFNDWTYALLAKYIGDYQLTSSGETRVSSWTTFDFKTLYRVNDSWTLGLGIKNLTDKEPPVESAYYWPNYDQSMYNPQGRAVYLQLDSFF